MNLGKSLSDDLEQVIATHGLFLCLQDMVTKGLHHGSEILSFCEIIRSMYMTMTLRLRSAVQAGESVRTGACLSREKGPELGHEGEHRTGGEQ